MIGVAVLVAGAAAAWVYRDTSMVRGATRPVQDSAIGRWTAEQARSLTGEGRSPRAGDSTAPAGTTSDGSLHKCTGDAGTTYTNAACPPGTRRAAVGGAVTVLPAVRAPAPAAAPASGPVKGPLSEMAGPPLKGSVRDQHIDAMR